MNYGKKIVASIRHRLGEQNPNKKEMVTGTINDTSYRLELAGLDKFSFVLDSLQLNFKKSERVSGDKLHELGHQLCRKITYLNELLVVTELDSLNNLIQLRSKLPEERPIPFSYFEVEVRGGTELSLARFTNEQKNRPRLKSSFHFSEEVLTRFLNDVAASFSSDAKA